MIGALAWFVIAWFAHQTLIGMATGAKGVSRSEAPKLYNTLENLCVSRGLPMPALQIIDQPCAQRLCVRACARASTWWP